MHVVYIMFHVLFLIFWIIHFHEVYTFSLQSKIACCMECTTRIGSTSSWCFIVLEIQNFKISIAKSQETKKLLCSPGQRDSILSFLSLAVTIANIVRLWAQVCGAFLQVCYTTLWCSMSSCLIKVRRVSRRKHVTLHPLGLVALTSLNTRQEEHQTLHSVLCRNIFGSDYSFRSQAQSDRMGSISEVSFAKQSKTCWINLNHYV